MKTDSIEKLNTLLEQIGYTQGPMNVIALLGSVGEAGETIGEYLKQFHSHAVGGLYVTMTMRDIVRQCKVVDDLKKHIRDSKQQLRLPPLYEFNDFDESKMDMEIADELYYLLAKMKCRGKDINFYAELSYNKVDGRIKKNIAAGIKHLEMPKDHH